MRVKLGGVSFFLYSSRDRYCCFCVKLFSLSVKFLEKDKVAIIILIIANKDGLASYFI
jgi:hypothetical protein